MGQKVNPILFRLGEEPALVSSSPLQKRHLPHLLIQELECRKFLNGLLSSRGILPRSCNISRSPDRLIVELDLYFTTLFLKESKLFWVRSLFKTMKKKYSRIRKVKDLKDFLETSQNPDEAAKEEMFFLTKKKFLSSAGKRRKAFYPGAKKANDLELVYKRRLFYFLFFQKKKEILRKTKEKHTLFGISLPHRKPGPGLVRMGLFKLNRLFGVRSLKYDLSHLFLKNALSLKKPKDQGLHGLNRFLCESLRRYTGVEEVQLRLFSSQLMFLPAFRFFKKYLSRELSFFRRSRDLKKYFLETLEMLFFVLGTFGRGNAFLLGRFLVHLFEKNRKQLSLVKFLKKALQVFFQKLPKGFLAVEGIKILIKGRFNKRRRTKKVVLHEGQISLQTLETSLDYYQTQAITLYGSFGIKVWISKRKISS